MMTDIKFNLNDTDYFLYENLSSEFLNKSFSNYTNNKISNAGLDFLTIGLIVSLVDRKIQRNAAADGWSRKLNVTIPVLNLEKWNKCKNILENALSFVSGDYWKINFSERNYIAKETEYLNSWSKKRRKKIENDEIKTICMFSGGLDSFIGAIDLLSTNINECVFINIRGGGNSFKNNFESARDAICNEFLITKKDKYFKSFLVKPWKAIEDTTRSRSFTFFTHAIAYSTCFSNHIDLIIPENGTISLNVPLSYGRYGSCSTRTTHPHYVGLLQQIINTFELNITLKNPYQFKTKGEMLIECKRFDFAKNNIVCTMSCSHPNSGRYQGNGKPGHCGTCLPCLIREAAELKAYGEVVTKYRNSFSKTTISTLRCLRFKISRIQKENVLVEIQKNGQLMFDLEKYCQVYSRSINELKNLVDMHLQDVEKE